MKGKIKVLLLFSDQLIHVLRCDHVVIFVVIYYPCCDSV